MFANVILPLALPGTLTYSIPTELEGEVVVGGRVVVQVGKKKLYSAIVQNISATSNSEYSIKPIISVIDNLPIVNEKQLALWQWMAEYYMCTLGEVMRTAIPNGLKMQSETQISLSEKNSDDIDFTDSEANVYNAIENNGKPLTLDNLIDKIGKKNIMSILQTLFEKGAICIDENIQSKYKPKLETLVCLHKNIDSEEKLQAALDSLKRAKAQENLLINYISNIGDIDFNNPKSIEKSKLLKLSKSSNAILKACIEKHIFETKIHEIGRLHDDYADTQKPSALSDVQQTAFNEIEKNFETKNTVLLHGVTSSGKTEIYLKLIEKQLQQGKQVLYLLPEIALTTQLVARLKKVFGTAVGVYHSKYSEAERVEIYKNIIDNTPSSHKYSIIIGARSALFLPYSNLGLVIVDEEHETSYKQYDPAPRYNARDAAIVLAHIHSAKTLLGTATPSIESYYNAQCGKFGFVKIAQRYGNVALPKFRTISILRAYAKKQINGHFTQSLLEAIYAALKQKEQVILFQNRRGFAPYLQCDDCGEIPKCKNCDVTLTYYKHDNSLRCHYCGYSTTMISNCPACNSTNIVAKGFGTEKIEEELHVIFPEARVARFDLDTARTRNAYAKIISNFENRETDILIGTQMVSKGLDFDNVSIVGILNADNMLNFPDFRAHERAFQLITQVGGRAGRREKQGLVIIQTYNPENKTIREIVDNDYERFYARQIAERKEFNYPPFFRLINITLKHRNVNVVNNAALCLAENMRKIFGANVLGPEAPAINKIQNKFINIIYLKLNRNSKTAAEKTKLRTCFDELIMQEKFKTITIQVDVDP